MIPIRMQNIQIGALSADKAYQSQKHLPQNVQRIFEAEVQKQLEDARERTTEAEKTEKSRIQDEEKQNQQKENEPKNKHETQSDKHQEENQIIEKNENGTIKHIDIKI
jgi:hypothetical protein